MLQQHIHTHTHPLPVNAIAYHFSLYFSIFCFISAGCFSTPTFCSRMLTLAFASYFLGGVFFPRFTIHSEFMCSLLQSYGKTFISSVCVCVRALVVVVDDNNKARLKQNTARQLYMWCSTKTIWTHQTQIEVTWGVRQKKMNFFIWLCSHFDALG